MNTELVDSGYNTKTNGYCIIIIYYPESGEVIINDFFKHNKPKPKTVHLIQSQKQKNLMSWMR